MNTKVRLTIIMWALPPIFLLIIFPKSLFIKILGTFLLVIHGVLWGKLLSEIDGDKKGKKD